MSVRASVTDASRLGGTPIVKPGEVAPGAGIPKLPPPQISDGPGLISEELLGAWTNYMANGFKQNEEMFKRTLSAYMKPYQLTLWLYGALFAVGLSLVVVAAVAGLMNGASVVPIVFAGLGAGTFLMFFIRHPIQALEENLEFITWLGVVFNTYWTRLMYIQDIQTVQSEIVAANDDFIKNVQQLIDKHAALRGKRSRVK